MNKEILIVAGHEVKQDHEGRYCLNDLHRASGGEAKHKVFNFTARAEFKELKAEIEKAGIPAIFKRQRLGTFVVKELVYSYAMWISPAFNLKVLRAFDTLQTQGVAIADHAAEAFLDDPLEFYGKLYDQARQLKAERDEARLLAEERGEKVAEYEPIVKFVTVNEYCSRDGFYPPKGISSKLGKRASAIAREKSLELGTKAVRGTTKHGGEFNSLVNVYPIEILDKAYKEVMAA